MLTKLVLIDDREAVREGIKLLIHTQPDLQVIADMALPSPAYELVDRGDVDVAMVSQDLADLSGVAVTRELVRRRPRLNVLVMAVRSDDDSVRAALAAGARGYVLRQQTSSQIFDAIRAVARGDVYLAPRIAHIVVQDHLRLRRGERAEAGPCDNLSPRERDVFDLLVRGHSNEKISRLLGISTKTVETHRGQVLRKLELHSLVDLVRFAARHQIPLE
jgi:two-component system response regulator NreC